MSGWDELVSAALLGTGRHPVDVDGLPGPIATVASGLSDPDTRLLGAAALATNYRRAGVPAVAAVPAPAAADPESARSVGPAAAARLERLLAGNDAELLHEWLVAVAARGLRPPAETLPALLDAAGRQSSLRPALRRVLGERGRWLAAFRPEWLAFAPGPAAVEDAAVWTHGDGTARRAYLAGLRARDPAAARELLAAGWSTEPAADRLHFLTLLGTGLSTSDEPMLEAALDDRSIRVRQAAATLLAQLPDSAYSARMLERLRGWIRVDGGRIVVTPPAECDASMQRDMISSTPEERGVGPRAWWLRQVIEAAPLAGWRDLLGVDPATAVALPVAEEWAPLLRAGWGAAAARQRDPAWARALLGLSEVDTFALLNALPPARRADAVAARLHEQPGTAHTLLAQCPGPWPPALVDAVFALLRAELDPPATDSQLRGQPMVLRLAGHRLPPAAVGRVQELAPVYEPGTAWYSDYTDVVDLLTFRSQLHEEIR
jgi:hypothetical protein